MQFLIAALETDEKLIQKRVLKCVYWSLIQSEYQIKLPRDKKNALDKIINKLVQSEEKTIVGTSREIQKMLNEISAGGVTNVAQQVISNNNNEMSYNMYGGQQPVNFY